MRTLLSALVAALVSTLFVGSAPPASSASTSVSVSATASVSQSQADCRRTRPAYPEIKPGTTSGAVRSLQCVLNDAGLGPVTVDGFYGPETQAAIREFTNGFECCIPKPLRVRTWYWTMLFNRSHNLRGLQQGDSGIRVTTLQRALRADGETLVIDGDFGGQTTAQVKVFQGKCGLKKTGRINDDTHFFLSQGGCNSGS